MTSAEACQTLKALAVLTLLAVAAPCTSVAQSALESAADRQRQIVEEIEREQSLNGPRSEALIAPLTALALLYQENGDRGLATATIERVLEVVRANYGLHSLEQAPLIWQLIANEERLGNVDASWNLQKELLTLARRHPEDLRAVPIFHELAERRLDLLQRYKAGERPREFILGCYYDYPGPDPSEELQSCVSGSRSVAIGQILLEAHWYYAEAIGVILRNELYSSEELRELEMEAVQATFKAGLMGKGLEYCDSSATLAQLLQLQPLGSCLEPILKDDSGFSVLNVGGQSSLVRLLLYEARSSAPALTRVSALIRLADWTQRHSSSGRTDDTVSELYALALEQLKELGETSTIDDVFSPPVPVVLPTFAPNPLLSQETPYSTGYIDVAFDISKRGESDHIEILDTTTEASRGAERELTRLIKRSAFRPRAANGQLVDSSRVMVRYYVNE